MPRSARLGPSARAADPLGSADATPQAASNEAEELAKKLSNPISSLISVPLQSNFDFEQGPKDQGFRYTMNIQPVVPIPLGSKFNLISRTILPVLYQQDMLPSAGEVFGLGDLTQSLFLSPTREAPGGIIWGAGPALLAPSATREVLGARKWGAGPTAVALKMIGPLTAGVLANHIWSFAGTSTRPDVNATFLQPFLAYNTKIGTSFTVNSESTFDWEAGQWTVSINAGVAQIFKLAGQRVQVGLFGRAFPERPADGPDWGFRIPIVFLFPR